ncbi:MAG TPA: Smr/MutS family protein [Candidatus Faecisoma merdavium]|nr:Smr/MutS family protein [Candidatus Faecisoma merdavium]
MNLNDIIFIDNLPSLDLHGFDRETARVAINDFINDNIKLKNKFIVIIHGIGSGILKDATHLTLKKNKNVLEFKICMFNIGCTIVNINLTK